MLFLKRAVFLPVFLLAFAPALAALPAPWTPLGPFGGPVDSITADPVHPGVLYATTPTGAYKTTDAGISWTAIYLNPMPGGRVAVDPVHPAILYLTGAYPAAPVLKSVDGGAHWTPAAAGLPLYYPSILAVDPARPRRLYVSANGFGLWRSEDAGASWQEADSGLPGGHHATVFSISAASRPAGTVLAATTRGVFRSVDGGLSWRPAAGLTGTLASAVAFAPSDPRTAYASLSGGGLHRSTDGGLSWRRVQTTAVYASEISVSPRDPRLLYLRVQRALLRSTDGGGHLVPANAPTGEATAVAADPFTTAAVWAGIPPGTSPGGVWRSPNQGQTWGSRSRGLTGIATTSLAISSDDPRRLWTSTPYGPYRSGNGGARWTRVAMPPGEDGLAQVAAGAGDRIFALTFRNPDPRQETPAYSLWRTDDDGASWTRLPMPLAVTPRFRVAPSDLSTLYAVETSSPIFGPTVQGLLRSTDGGEHWESRTQTTLSCGLGDLAVSPSDSQVVYLGCKAPGTSAVLRSRDGGATFTDVSAGPPGPSVQALAVDPRDPDTVWAGTAGSGIWKSEDGGASWTRAGDELASLTVTALLAPDLPGRVWAATRDGRVFRSDDGGASWEDRSAGLLATGVSGLVADPDDPRRIYAVTANGIWLLVEAD